MPPQKNCFGFRNFVLWFGIFVCLFRKVLFNPQGVVHLSTMYMSPPKYFFQLTNKALAVQPGKSLSVHLPHDNLVSPSLYSGTYSHKSIQGLYMRVRVEPTHIVPPRDPTYCLINRCSTIILIKKKMNAF